MRQGIADGFVLPAEIIPGIASVIAGAQYAKAEDSPFWVPFAEFPAGVAEADRARLAAAGKAAIERQVIPAFAEFKAFFDGRVRSGCAQVDRGDRPAGRQGVLRRPRALLHDLARCDGGEDPRRRARRGRAHPRRDGGDRAARSGSRAASTRSSCSCAPIRSSTRRRRSRSSGTPRGSRARSTAACRSSSASFPRAPYTVKPVPAALAPNYTGGRYNPGRSARPANTGSTRTRCRTGRSTCCPR